MANLQYLFLLKMIHDELRLAYSKHSLFMYETTTHINEKILSHKVQNIDSLTFKRDSAYRAAPIIPASFSKCATLKGTSTDK